MTRLQVKVPLPSWVDRRSDAMYDRVRMKAGQWTPEEIVCFRYPAGGQDPFTGHMRTYADTNMTQAHEFPAPQSLIVRRFLFLFQPSCVEKDVNGWLANYAWEFRIMNKIFNREPVLTCAMTGSPEDLIPDFGKDLGDSGAFKKLGTGVAWDLAEFEDSRKYIPPICYFDVALRGTSFRLESDIDFYVMLQGLRDVPVQ